MNTKGKDLEETTEKLLNPYTGYTGGYISGDIF